MNIAYITLSTTPIFSLKFDYLIMNSSHFYTSSIGLKMSFEAIGITTVTRFEHY